MSDRPTTPLDWEPFPYDFYDLEILLNECAHARSRKAKYMALTALRMEIWKLRNMQEKRNEENVQDKSCCTRSDLGSSVGGTGGR